MGKAQKVIVQRTTDKALALELKPPTLPEHWDYEASVKKVRAFVYKWSNITRETGAELWIAREKLRNPGVRTDLDANAPRLRTWTTYCRAIGSTKSTVNRWLARLYPGEPLVSKMTGFYEYFTPMDVIKRVRAVLGTIDLDPASCDFAQKTIQAKRYYTLADNGLIKNWAGNVFLNPPYSMPQIKQFTNKLLEELPNINQAILLTNDQTDTLWWQKAVRKADLICMPKGRIHFYTRERPETSPTNGQSFFYYGRETTKFSNVFAKIGVILRVII